MTHARGFTLIELLIAITLSAVLLGLLYRGVSQSLQQWQRTSGVQHEAHAQQQSRHHLHRQLRQALPLQDAQGSPLLKGDAQRLTFISYLNHPIYGGLYQYQLQSGPPPAASRLTLTPYQHTDTNTAIPVTAPPTTELVLYRGPHALELSYARRDAQGQLHWQRHWPPTHQPTAFPALVQLQTRASHSDATWPPLVIELRHKHHGR